MSLDVNMGITGVFSFEKFNKDGVVETINPFKNTVLDSGLLLLASKSIKNLMTYVNVGNGSDAVDVTQTGLTGGIKKSTNVVYNSVNGFSYSRFYKYVSYYRTFQFAIGTVTGIFREVGLSLDNNSSYLNRQLLKNDAGEEIAVVVAEDEGLRISAEVRVYLDPSINVYSEIYFLNIFGATSGNIVLRSLTQTLSIPYATLNDAELFKKILCTFSAGVDCVTNIEYWSDGTIVIFTHPQNSFSLELSIESHTLIGGSNPPVMTLQQAFGNSKKKFFIDFTDITTGGVESKEVDLYPSIIKYSLPTNNITNKSTANTYGDNYMPWGYIKDGNYLSYFSLNEHRFGAIRSSGALVGLSSSTITKPATLGDSSFEIVSYYAPGALGTGGQELKAIGVHFRWDDTVTRLFVFVFKDIITIKDIESFTFKFKVSWGRYEGAI